jgi:predicted RNase H-like nuclease (RuvC/YqgF family)
MAEAKVYPMNAFVSVLRGEAADQAQLEMLAYLTGSEAIEADVAPVAQALSKAWIYEQEPGLTKYAEGDIAALGNQVKVEALPEAEATRAQAVLDILASLKADNAALQAQVEKLEAEKAGLAAEMAPLAAKVKTIEAAESAGENKVSVASSKLDEMTKKLNDLMAEVDKVKSQGVVVAGVAGDGAAADAGGDAGVADGPVVGGEPEADFGLGGDAFGGDTW